MAYLDKPHTHKRLASLTGVALIHIALAAGLVAGLTVKVFAPAEPPIIRATQIPLPDPVPPDDTPPPDAKQPDQSASTPPVAPIPKLDLGPPPVFELTNEIPPPLPPLRIPNPPRTNPPVERTTPAFTPHGAFPANGPAGWVTTNEYPSRALQRGWEGTVNYMLEISANGRVEACRIVGGNAHAILNDATCRWVERRARFEPAMDETGARIAGSYRGAVTWEIPED